MRTVHTVSGNNKTICLIELPALLLSASASNIAHTARNKNNNSSFGFLTIGISGENT